MIVIGATKVKINGIYYNLSKSDYSARVTMWVGDKYEGKISIPSHVAYQDVNYDVVEIEARAFYGCSELTYISIPGSVQVIGAQAFDHCEKLETISGCLNLWKLGSYAFHSCISLKSVCISCETIPEYTFSSCEKLSDVYVVYCSKIGRCAFQRCISLEEIELPEQIEDIEEDCFSGCEKIKTIICTKESVPTMNNNSFDLSVFENATLYVPALSLDAYKSSIPWNQFKNIVAIKETGISSVPLDNYIKEVHSINGNKLKSPSKGINIIKQEDGTIKKVLIK